MSGAARTTVTSRTSLESLVTFRNSSGTSGRATLLHLTRYSVAFEVYNPYSIVQLSEVLHDLVILRQDRPIYRGRAVIKTLVPTGALTIVSAALLDTWSDLHGLLAVDDIRQETERFIQNWKHDYQLRPEYQLAVNNLASFLEELSRWLGQAEALYADHTSLASVSEARLLDQVWPPLETKLHELFELFEAETRRISPQETPVHKAFAQRELHPLLLCDPFNHRIFTKPLGYAGDYQMVNMMLAPSGVGASTYAKVINRFTLSLAPAAAHRNRIDILEQTLRREARRTASAGHGLRALNIGSGPAAEIQRFIASDAASAGSELTVVDFNEETLEHAERRIAQALRSAGRTLQFGVAHQSIHELLKSAASGRSAVAGQYDFVYCAGLFDYLSERICRKLVRLFLEWTAPGGLVLVTNVHSRNPIRGYMEHVVEWYLEYRDEEQLRRFVPEQMPCRLFTDATGVNLFLEIRKNED
jgi:extracellular factor (EF) 3-hydroxypalmitic acid methyl ester biosynthesis protein